MPVPSDIYVALLERAIMSGDPNDMRVVLDCAQAEGLGNDQPAVRIVHPNGRVETHAALRWSAADYASSRFGQALLGGTAVPGRAA